MCVCVQTAEDKIQTPTTETDGETDDDVLAEEAPEINAYPMIILSVDSETETKVRKQEDDEEDPTPSVSTT